MTQADGRTFRLGYAAWLFGIFAFFIPAATWNPVSRFNLTRAIVEHGTLAVDAYATSTGDRAHVGEHWYSDKPPIVAFVAVPAYAAVLATQRLRGTAPEFRAFSTAHMPAAKVIPNHAYQQALYVCSLLTSGVAGVGLALLLFEFLRRRASTTSAFLGSSLVVLGTPILPYATSLYGHVAAAAMILGAIFCLDPLGSSSMGGPPERRKLLMAGACMGLAAGTEYLTVFPAALVLLWYLARMAPAYRLRALAQLVLGGAGPALIVAAYHAAAFGAPWRTGYSFEDQAEFVAGHSSGIMGIHLPSLAGLYGLTFSARRGLFYLAPATALALVLSLRFAVQKRDWAVQAGLGVLATLLLLNAGYYMWWGGASAGPRHLVPGIAYLSVGLASAFDANRRWLRLLIAALALVSVVNFFAITLVGIEPPEFADILQGFVWPRLREGHLARTAGASNLGIKLGLGAATSVIPLVLWTFAGFLYLLRKTSDATQRPPVVASAALADVVDQQPQIASSQT